MSRQPVASATIRGWQNVLENSFTGGLKTEFTGLNFPENSCTATTNCTFYQTGAVFRRNGFDYESGFTTNIVNRTNSAISTFIWTNAGGDGATKLYVVQIGATLYFYQLTNATLTSPISTTLLVSTVTLSSDPTIECQFAAGNGYLFVFNASADPLYCIFNSGTVTSNPISLLIRDFVGTAELILPGPDTYRPTALSGYHLYNLQNQGWTSQSPWTANSATKVLTGTPLQYPISIVSFQVQAGLSTVTIGQSVTITGIISAPGNANVVLYASGLVFSYSGTTLALNVTASTAATGALFPPSYSLSTTITPANAGGQVNTWNSAIGNYPSNADVWWSFKDSTLVFNPTVTVNNVTLGSGPAPKGFYILQAFNQQRAAISGTSGDGPAPITDIVTTKRPKTGTFFAGRVWYAGVDDGQVVAGSATSWSENIYFSQIAIKPEQFARCYQTNDPTSETLFDILPSDGGVITIQGSGSIYKLFPITNGLLVFAANGIWFITGSTGIGFSATDYTISKLSAIQSISSTSFVDVLGYPMFWNEEGVYSVSIDSQAQGLSVNSLTLHTIKQFYDKIPKQSKKFARGAYNAITGQVEWIYRSTNESTVTDRYQYDSVLTLSMFIQAFYPWTISTPGPYVHDIQYVTYTGGATSPLPTFKYLTSNFVSSNYQFTFSEERDNINWKDWTSAGLPTDYTSSFTTAYRLHGDAQRRFQPTYVYMYSDNTTSTSYKIQGQWNFAIDPNSNRYTTVQVINNNLTSTKFGKVFRRHRIRGNGYVLQMHVFSVSGQPFNIMGWSLAETQNQSV